MIINCKDLTQITNEYSCSQPLPQHQASSVQFFCSNLRTQKHLSPLSCYLFLSHLLPSVSHASPVTSATLPPLSPAPLSLFTASASSYCEKKRSGDYQQECARQHCFACEYFGDLNVLMFSIRRIQSLCT